MEISIEKLVSLVTAEVVKELVKQGIKVTFSSGSVLSANAAPSLNAKVQKIDMSKYKTPILTENHIRRLHALTGAVIVPKETIVTPKAKELIREKQINLVVE